MKLVAFIIIGDKIYDKEIHRKPNCGDVGRMKRWLPVAELCRKEGISNVLKGNR